MTEDLKPTAEQKSAAHALAVVTFPKFAKSLGVVEVSDPQSLKKAFKEGFTLGMTMGELAVGCSREERIVLAEEVIKIREEMLSFYGGWLESLKQKNMLSQMERMEAAFEVGISIGIMMFEFATARGVSALIELNSLAMRNS